MSKNVTIDEMLGRLSTEQRVIISRSALGAWLRGCGWTFKKKVRVPTARPAGRPDASASLV
ncbi:transposase [Rhizobium leguminosarum]|nr:transposase [Rhizobium leguminosarum]